MERLKDSLEHLEAPICPNCSVGMRWFRSELVQADAQQAVAHLFVCPNCKRAQSRDTTFIPERVLRDKSAAPRVRVVAR